MYDNNDQWLVEVDVFFGGGDPCLSDFLFEREKFYVKFVFFPA
jgi:hypothetical protein